MQTGLRRALRKQRLRMPPGDYRYCACSRLHSLTISSASSGVHERTQAMPGACALHSVGKRSRCFGFSAKNCAVKCRWSLPGASRRPRYHLVPLGSRIGVSGAMWPKSTDGTES